MKTDVLIVGGGASGGSLACALSSSPYFQRRSQADPFKIVMIDGSPLPSMAKYRVADMGGEEVVPQRVPEPRVVTLSPNSVKLFESLGVMDHAE
mmetsp:Transcript_18066/g.30822  ORF Transcript_18066/g.30822 Transcript_18066/m.30822 type:complete len:94 (-) Transcript_18066:1236-1517(-)